MIPVVEKMEIFPVAGHDCMELNLSGAHAPYFTRNIVILTDSNGVEGVGEVPGGEKITNALEQVKDLVVGTSIADYKQTLNKVRKWLDANIKDDVRGLQTFDLRTGVHVVTAIEAPLLDLLGKFLDVPAAAPVIKVCSRNEMKAMWQDLIDVNAGPIATGEATIQEIGTQLFNKIIAVASGKDQSFAEKYKLHNDLCIFNPAPIT